MIFKVLWQWSLISQGPSSETTQPNVYIVYTTGDLDGHFSEEADNNKNNGSKGFGIRNEIGAIIVDFPDTDLVVNT